MDRQLVPLEQKRKSRSSLLKSHEYSQRSTRQIALIGQDLLREAESEGRMLQGQSRVERFDFEKTANDFSKSL